MFRIAFFALLVIFLLGGYGLYQYRSLPETVEETRPKSEEEKLIEEEKSKNSHYFSLQAVSVIFLGICALAFLGSLCLLFAGSLGALFILPTGAFTVYYLTVYLGIKHLLHGQSHEALFILAWILLLLPLIALILKPEETFEFFMQGVHLDMRH